MKTTTPTDFSHLATAERQPAHIGSAQARANEAAFLATLDAREPAPFALTFAAIKAALTAPTTTPLMELAQALANAIARTPGRVVLARQYVTAVLVRAAYHYDTNRIQLLVRDALGEHWDYLQVGDNVCELTPEMEAILAEKAAQDTQRAAETRSLLNPGERLVHGGFELDGYKLSYSHTLCGANENAQRWASKKTMWPDVVMHHGTLYTVRPA